MWSSLSRYYLFLTASQWGIFIPEIHLDEVMSLPIRFPKENILRERILNLVNILKDANDPYLDIKINHDFMNYSSPERTKQYERELDKVIFDLYELNETERDLILDMCGIGLDYYYKSSKSNACKEVDYYSDSIQGKMENLPKDRESEKGLEGYLYSFLKIWNSELEPNGEFRWRIICSKNSPMIAVIFTTQEKETLLPEISYHNETEWDSVLKRCGESLRQHITERIYIDGMVRGVTDTDIFIIKRNERRLWTRSMAREDAEATLLQAINMQLK